MIRILCFGDVTGDCGSKKLLYSLNSFKEELKPDFIIVNGENSNQNSKGPGVNFVNAAFDAGVDVITGGNHSFDNKFAGGLYTQYKHLLRPLNFPTGTPGAGCCIVEKDNLKIGVVNLQLRTFMREMLACPFRTADSIIDIMKKQTDIIVFDIHGEATAEKVAFGAYIDGRASIIFGTHTHVQTADARILPKGTAYITDIGMCGVLHSSLGIKFENIINRFLTQLPTKFDPETEGNVILSGIVVDIDEKTGKAIKIERIYKEVE
jgi:metallophosphoesterase (TIGR00282 family)